MTPGQANVVEWRKNPAQFVWDQFGATPDAWQLRALEAFASPDPSLRRIALSACAGPGKSTILAWCVWNFLLCYGDRGEHPKGAMVSVTAENLGDNAWAELSKWYDRSEVLRRTFTWTKTRVFANDHPATWFMAARSFSKTANPEEQGRTLSGLHSKFVLAVIDECGDIPVTVLKAGEQALSTDPIFGKILAAGNPTSHEGILYAASTQLRHLWHVIKITGDPDDPNRSPRIGLEWAREQIKTYGRDSPWVMAYILGEFPPSSINSLLGPDEVHAAMNRVIHEEDYKYAQKRLGVDVARMGDDRTILFPRQGLRAFPSVEMRNARTQDIVARIALAKHKWGAELEFVDGTGGYGAGVVDALLQAGHSPQEIHFSSKPLDARYFNRRSEMLFLMAEWVKRGGALPNDPELVRELTTPTYTFQSGKLRIEEKEQIKKRLGFSPDKADALALTFALPDMPASASLSPLGHQRGKLMHEWEPYQDEITPPPARVHRPQ